MSLILRQGDNSTIPDQPEYGKAWKPEFNHGCCPSCNEPEPPVCTTKTQAFTRTNRSDDLVSLTTNRYCRCQGESPVSGCEEPINSVDCSSITA